jgi:hypothetical protein
VGRDNDYEVGIAVSFKETTAMNTKAFLALLLSFCILLPALAQTLSVANSI